MIYIDFFKTEDRKKTIPLQLRFNFELGKYFKIQSDIYVDDFLENEAKVEIKKTLESDLDEATEAMIPIWTTALVDGIDLGILTIKEEVAGANVVAGFGVQALEAEKFAKLRAAEMVTKVNDTTKKEINNIIVKGLEEGKDVTTIAKEIKQKFVDFSKFRSKLIASQEIGEAYEFGKFNQAKEFTNKTGEGLQKKWITQGDDRVSVEICMANNKEGWILFEKIFQSGHEKPLGHIGCRCYATYRASE